MEAVVFSLRSLSSFTTSALIVKVVLLLFLVFCWDYPLLLLYRLAQRVIGRSERRGENARALPVLVVIPSLLRKRDELTSMISTVRSVAANGYPGDLTIILTIDGCTDAPLLYAELKAFAAAQDFGEHQRLYVTGTPKRRSKPMAIDHAMEFVKRLVAEGALLAIPPVYVSTDADADLAPNAIEHIVYRLQRRNRLTGSPARAVAGALHVRGNNFWRGWRQFFTIEGQLNLQVAREYYVGNVWRYNIRWLPVTGVPGAFYCTWSEIFLAIPSFMGYMRTLRTRHWLGWWIGIAPPRFSDTHAQPIPELMAGDTDDTVTAYAASIARYENGHFTFDPPRTPFHALLFMLRGILIDRPIHFAPEARVFTSSPNSVKGLFRQRKRWNSSRVELTGRFWPVLGYHWALGLPAMLVKLFMARSVFFGVFAYFVVPLFLFRSYMLTGFLLGYLCNLTVWGLMTLFALLINDELGYWRLAIGLPLAPIYQFLFNWIPSAVGVSSDVVLFGNVTGFAPEATLVRGGSVRIALLARLRRSLALMLRSIAWGDVPLGAFWLGWRETAWTPSGFEGFGGGGRRAIVPPLSQWFRPKPAGQPEP